MEDKPLTALSDDELLARLKALLRDSRSVEADLVAHIGEIERRGLYGKRASCSMYVYCTHWLHLSDGEAYLRIHAARAARKFPVLLDMLRDGRLHLTGLVLIAPHLTPENLESVLPRAIHRTKREVEELVAELEPRPDVPDRIRKRPERPRKDVARRPELHPDAVIPDRPQEDPASAPRLHPDGVAPPAAAPAPAPAPGASTELRAAAPAPSPAPRPDTDRGHVEPLSPGRYKVTFTASRELRDKLERLSALTSERELAAVIEAAVTEKLQRIEARRFGQTDTPRKTLAETDTSATSRHVPAAVRRLVFERDGGQCRFVDDQGNRCPERHALEYHHAFPYGYGGDHDPERILLMCTRHNQLIAEADYGAAHMARCRSAGRRAPAAPREPSL